MREEEAEAERRRIAEKGQEEEQEEQFVGSPEWEAYMEFVGRKDGRGVEGELCLIPGCYRRRDHSPTFKHPEPHAGADYSGS